MGATPTINISGGFANRAAMSMTASSTVWFYEWTVATSQSTEVIISVEGKDVKGNSYLGSDTLKFYVIANPEGSGVNDPYLINDLDDLHWLAKNETAWNKIYRQTAHIDASSSALWNDPGTDSGTLEGFCPGNADTAFKGAYDGQNFSINGMTINRADQDYVGLLVMCTMLTYQYSSL